MKIHFSRIIAIVVLVSIGLHSFSQYYATDDKNFLFEAGLGAGGMNCATDLGGPKGNGGYFFNDVNWQNTKLSGSIYASVLYKHTLAMRLEGTLGSVKAYDSILKGIATKSAVGRYQRNLSFQSPIKELALLGEFYPLMLRKFDNELPLLSPYLVGGIGIFSFDPQAQLNGEWVRLKPLHTEGEGFLEYPGRKPYKLTQVNICFGAGLRYQLRHVNLRLEFINRRLFTDYLDDASTNYIDPLLFDKYLAPSLVETARTLYNRSATATGFVIKRGNVKNTDAYMSFNVKAGIKFGNGAIEFRGQKARLGCKRI